jgi:hypothetical protein
VIEALILALIGIWLFAAWQVASIERDAADLAMPLTKLRIQRRRELRESVEAWRGKSR